MADLDALYDRTSSRTLTTWALDAGTGEPRTAPRYAKDKFALATGITPALTPAISTLLQDLHALAAGDPLADVMPPASLHFTFLAITDAIYLAPDTAEDLSALTDAFAAITPLTVSIHELRLVALADQLLLAGIPDAQSLQRREDFTAALQSGPWASALAQRYGNTPLPPPFWHSTLVRYEAARLPVRFRDYFLAHQQARFGEVSAPLKLAMVDYNWTKKALLAAPSES